jgi:hypothetical protein
MVSLAVFGLAEGAVVVASGAEVVSIGVDVVLDDGNATGADGAVGDGDAMTGEEGAMIGIIEATMEGKSTVVGANGAKDPQSLLHWK